MKKVLKRFMSALSALSIAMTGITAFAKQTVTDTGYWKQSFDGLTEYTVPDNMYINIDAAAADSDTLAALSADGVNIGGKSRDLGKADEFFAAEKLGGAVVLGAVDSADAASLKKATGLAAAVSGTPKVHVSFETAISDYATERKVLLDARAKAGSGAFSIALITIAADGAVKAGISSTDYTMPLDKWVRFDLYFSANSSSTSTPAIVYADGKQIASAATIRSGSGTKMNGVKSVESVKLSLASGESGCYMDNLTVERVSEYSEPTETVLTHTNPEISGRIDNDTKSIELVSSVTAEELLQGLNLSDVTVVDRAGTAQSGGLCDGYVIADGVYYKLSTYDQTNYLKINFNNAEISDAQSLAELGLILSGEAEVLTRGGIGARDADNTALEVASPNGESVISWTAKNSITDDKIVVESSVMSAEGAQVSFAAVSGDEAIAIAELAEEAVNGCISRDDYFWYKAVAVIDNIEKTAQIYINGILMSESELNIEGIEGITLTVNGGTAAVDDLAVYAGEYVTGTDKAEVTSSSTDYIISDSSKTIYIPANTNIADLSEYIIISDNAQLDSVYADAAMSQNTADGSVSDGDIIVFVTKTKSVYEAYKIKVTDAALGIQATSSKRNSFDNAAETIFVPAYMTASALISSFTLAPGHSASVIDADGKALADSDKIYRGTLDGYRYVISYSNSVGTFTKSYEILTQYLNETFDDLYGTSIPAGSSYNGFVYGKQGVSGGTVIMDGVSAPDDETEYVARLYSKPGSISGTPQMTFRINEIEEAKTKSPYAITWDVYVGDTNSSEQMILKYTNKDGAAGNYYTLFEFASGGVVKFAGQSVATYSAGEWNRVTMLLDPSGTASSAVYINGKRVYYNTVSRFQKTIDSIQEFIFTHGVTAAERVCYYDNMSFYPISSVSSFDAAPLDCVATTEYDILSGNTVSGYGPATAAQAMALFSYPEGSAHVMTEADGVTVVPDDKIAEAGMKLTTTSANGQFSQTYTLAEPIRITAPQILIGGRSMNYLIEGDAAATAGVYSAYPLPMTLTLTYTDGAQTLTQTSERGAEETGSFSFETDAVAAVKNVEGEKLTLTLTSPDGTIEYAPALEIEWTGRLDLGSEIMAAKNGATSIVTITLDDGLTNTLNKCNSWFATYGLKGTSIVWSDRAAASESTYKKIYDAGYIDVGSHSKTHADLTTVSGLTDEKRMQEIRDSRDELSAMFDQEVITFAPSNNHLDTVSQSIIGDYYWAVRQGQRGYNSISPAEGNSAGQWNNLRIQGAHNPLDKDNNACELNDILDIAASEPMWLIEMFHSIETKSGQGTLPVLDSAAAPHFQKMGAMQDAGDIWVASFAEATKYIRERQNTTINDVATETSRTVTLTMDTDFLPAETFNYPLTVRSSIPAEWADESKYIKVTQGGRVQSPAVRNTDGGLYVYYDAYPTGGEITLELVDERPMVTVNAINITSEGTLSQIAGEMTPVIFTASTSPTDNTDTSGIQWYVNDVLQTSVESGTLTFEFLADKVGTYTIYAKDGISGFVSKSITVTLKEGGVLFEDDFDSYNASVLPSTNWYATVEVGLEEYPVGSGDIAAAIRGVTGYPGMHKTVSVSEGQPTVFTGNAAMLGAKQQFYLEMRNTVTVTSANRITAMTIDKNGDIKAVDGTVVANIPAGEWVHYALCVTPAAAGELSKLRYVLSGDALTGAGGVSGEPVVYETEYDLDKLALAENGTVNMVHNNNFASADASCVTYLDDVRIYNPQTLKLTSVSNDYLSGETVLMKFNSEVYNFDPNMVSVTDANGAAVPIASAVLENLGHRELALEFLEKLEKGAEYTVTVSGGESFVNVLGEAAGSAAGTFTVSTQNSIENLAVTAAGELVQPKDNMSAVQFTAQPTPAENVDLTNIKWYVNGALAGAYGAEFVFTPSEIGEYVICAKAADIVSESVTVTVTPTAAKAIAVEVSGRLYQSVENMSSVTFTVGPEPSDGLLDISRVEWYLNGEKTEATGAEFTFTPTEKGIYKIYAALADDAQVVSKSFTVNVLDAEYAVQEYLLEDDFENHGGAGTVFEEYACAPWTRALNSSAMWTEVAENPDASGDLTAKLTYTNAATSYPRIEKSGITVEAGKPIAISSKVYFNTATARLILELRGTARKEIAILGNSKVTVNGAAVDGATYPVGEWLWFTLCVIPGEEAASSKLILSLSNNAGEKTLITSDLDLSTVGLGTGRAVLFNTALTLGKGDAVYLNDAKIYYPESAFLIAENMPQAGSDSIDISFNHALSPSTFTKESVRVSANGEEIEVAEVVFDSLNPERATVKLASPMEENTVYRLWLDDTVRDIAGTPVYGTLVYGEENASGFVVTEAAAENGETKVTVQRTAFSEPQQISVYTARYDENGLKEVVKTDAQIDAGSGVQIITAPYSFEAEDGIRVFVWERDSMKPLYK